MLLFPFGNLSHTSIRYYVVQCAELQYNFFKDSISGQDNVIDKVRSDYYAMVLITCKQCGDINYFAIEKLGNLTDFGYRCRNYNTINRITAEDGELKKHG